MPYILRKTITETFLERVNATPDIVGFTFKPTYAEAGPPGPPTPTGQWKRVTFRQFYHECRIVSYGLMELGVRPGDRVAILSDTRYEWALMDIAILGARGVTVPIYASSTPDDITYIIEHSGAEVLVVENATQLQKIIDRDIKLKKIVVIEPHALGAHKSLDQVITLQAVKELGRREESKNPNRFDDNLREAAPNDLITICYTSGTTGIPKGAMLTHDNMMSVLEDSVAVLSKWLRSEKEVILSFLPFSHILGKAESMAVWVFGWQEAFAENADRLMINIEEIKPTIIFAVPRVFEKAFARIQTMIHTSPDFKRRLFDWGIHTGKNYYSAIWRKKAPSFRDAAEYKMAKRIVFKKVSQKFGGRLRFAVCGGAPFPKEIGEFFQIMGMSILEGYGLTETCAPVAINTPTALKFGSVGKPLPEVNIRIAEDGEVLVKSRKVFQGYYKMPKETEESLQDGWLHTGDIGHIDQDGFLQITDRKKDLIITSAGKNIAPQKIENLAKSHKLITQFVVHGDTRNYLTALVTLDREQIIKYAAENQILFSEYSELVKNSKIMALAQSMIDSINQQLASYETIKKFVILPNEFTIETGELTPSLKVRRKIVENRYKTLLESLYSDSQTGS